MAAQHWEGSNVLFIIFDLSGYLEFFSCIVGDFVSFSQFSVFVIHQQLVFVVAVSLFGFS